MCRKADSLEGMISLFPLPPPLPTALGLICEVHRQKGVNFRVGFLGFVYLFLFCYSFEIKYTKW